MERRLTAFLLPLLIAALAFFAFGPKKPPASATPSTAEPQQGQAPQQTPALPQGEPPVQAREAEAPVAAKYLEVSFGAIGEQRALWVKFDQRAASVVEVRLLDEPDNYDARHKPAQDWQIEDAYRLVEPLQTGLVSMLLDHQDPQRPQLQDADRLFGLWDVEQTGGAVTFRLTDAKSGLTLEKTYRHDATRRGLLLDLTVRAAAGRDETTLPAGDALRLTLRGACLTNAKTDQVFGNPASAIARQVDVDSRAPTVTRQTPNAPPAEPLAVARAQLPIDFAGTTNRFFGSFLVPNDDVARAALRRVTMERWPDARDGSKAYAPHSVPVALYSLDLRVPAAGEASTASYWLYLGPKSNAEFDEHEDTARFRVVMDYDLTPPCFCTVPGGRQIAGLLVWLMRQLHSVVGNWGFAIVLLTLIVRGSLVPLNFRMQKSMRAYGAKVQRLKPEMDALKERNKNDPKRLQQELAAFQRKHKLIPPLGGCLPMLVTIPVFLGLFTALRVAYELRLQPFGLWIHDLSSPDRLAHLGWGWLPYFNLLPIVMVVLWLVLQSMTPLPSDPQQRQVLKIMRFMPLLFGVMLFNYASGLMVYMITSSVFGLVEQKVQRKILGPPPAEGAAAVPTF